MNIIAQLKDLNWTPYTKGLTSADYSYEFWVKFKGIKLYAVHCKILSIPCRGNGVVFSEIIISHSYFVQFNNSNGQTFNVELLGGSPQDALVFFDEMYEKMDCIPYD